MRIVAIINPVAGASKQRQGVRRMLATLRAAGMVVEPVITAGAGDARNLARKAARQAGVVVTVGGDGTITEVADGLSGSGVPLIIWPTGTENLIARALGFRADPQIPLACLSAGRTISLDLGVANGRSFLAVAGVGFDAEAVHRLTRARTGHITHLTYLGPLWRTFWEHRFPAVRVIWHTAPQAEGPFCWEGKGLVFVGNLAAYALGLPVVRDARADDGALDLLILPCRGRARLIRHSLLTLWGGRHIEQAGVRYERVRQVRVESAATGPIETRAIETVPIEVDGDVAGHLPLEIAIRPAALRVRIPPSYPGR